jgi:hypothetical protein
VAEQFDRFHRLLVLERESASLSCFGNRLHLRQAFFKLPTDHFVHVHEQAHGLGDEIILARCPSDSGLIAFGLEAEFGAGSPSA